jgi:hypothetical protein
VLDRNICYPKEVLNMGEDGSITSVSWELDEVTDGNNIHFYYYGAEGANFY